MLHLMSAGRLAVGAKRLKTAMLVVEFESGRELMMSESGHKRRAGVWLLRPDALAAELAHIGPEPLDPAFTPAALARRCRPTRTSCTPSCATSARSPASAARSRTRSCTPRCSRPTSARRRSRDDEVDRLHAAITGVLGAAVERLVPLSGGRPDHQGRPRLRRPRPARPAVPALRRGHPAGVVRRAHGLLLPASARPAVASSPTGACHACYGSDRPTSAVPSRSCLNPQPSPMTSRPPSRTSISP